MIIFVPCSFHAPESVEAVPIISQFTKVKMKHLALSFTFAVLIFTVGAKKGYFARKPTKPSPAPVVETGWSNVSVVWA